MNINATVINNALTCQQVMEIKAELERLLTLADSVYVELEEQEKEQIKALESNASNTSTSPLANFVLTKPKKRVIEESIDSARGVSQQCVRAFKEQTIVDLAVLRSYCSMLNFCIKDLMQYPEHELATKAVGCMIRVKRHLVAYAKQVADNQKKEEALDPTAKKIVNFVIKIKADERTETKELKYYAKHLARALEIIPTLNIIEKDKEAMMECVEDVLEVVKELLPPWAA